MTTIKSYTDLEQSKKLIDILSLESADMWYQPKDKQSDEYMSFPHLNRVYANELPCWSLAALLGVIPNYKLNSEHNYHTCTAETSFGKETIIWFDNPIDACYEMIIHLNKLKML